MKKIMCLFLSVLFFSCTAEKSGNKIFTYKRTEFLMDTIVTFTLTGTNEQVLIRLADQAVSLMKTESLLFDHHDPSGGLTRFNRLSSSGAVQVPGPLAALIKRSLDMARLSEGYFDPTVYALKNLWNFEKNTNFVPEPDQIRYALEMVGYDSVHVRENEVELFVPGMGLDLGGIAKGTVIDLTGHFLKSHGVKSGIINAGGDLLLWGKSPQGKNWKIGVQHPRQSGSFLSVLDVTDTAVVTSGDYERFFEKDGKRYCHLLNPITGYPDSDLLSVTILYPYAETADALATAVFVLGLQKGRDFLRSHYPEAGYILVTEKKGKLRIYRK